MNECDREVAGEDGAEPQYRSGIEIALEDETEPADEDDLHGQVAVGAAARRAPRSAAPTATCP